MNVKMCPLIGLFILVDFLWINVIFYARSEFRLLPIACFRLESRKITVSWLNSGFIFHEDDLIICNKSLALLAAVLHFISGSASVPFYFNTA